MFRNTVQWGDLKLLDLFKITIDLKDNKSSLSNVLNEAVEEVYMEMFYQKEINIELFDLWKKDFNFIYGDLENNLSSNNKINMVKLSKDYGFQEVANPIGFFLSIQTVLAIFVKFMTFRILSTEKKYTYTESSFNKFLDQIDSGQIFKILGIENYTSRSWFSWIILSNNDIMLNKIRNLLLILDEYELFDDEDISLVTSCDYIKEIYEIIIPRELRHALGEYYTTDWVAEYTINQAKSISKRGIGEQSFLDPTCGSGTFIFEVIKSKFKSGCDVRNILISVFGTDINPLAVLIAKTNYIISLLDRFPNYSFSIPIFQYDVINYPLQVSNGYIIDLHFFGEITVTEKELMEHTNYGKFKKNYHDNELINSIINNMVEDRLNGMLIPKVDVIIGNPPWVNWEYLPEDYRNKSAYLWKDYNLFNVKGRALSFSKEDISVLITYITIDRNLKDDGILAFVIRQALFKSAQNGNEFRKFTMKDDEYPIKVERVDDFSNIKVFDNATNQTAIMFLRKGQPTTFPVDYFLWERKVGQKGFSFSKNISLEEVIPRLMETKMLAHPAKRNDQKSLWITATKKELEIIKYILGSNNYQARTGVFTGGANGVYWLKILGKIGNDILIENVIDRAKRKVDHIEAIIEPDLIFPMVRGSDIKQWEYKSTVYLLCPHTSVTKMKPIELIEMETYYPHTLDYLSTFRKELDQRKGFAGWEKEIQNEYFYSILRIGEYSFSKYKVAWKYIASKFITCVIGPSNDFFLGKKTVLPNEKVMYVGLNDECEAYYLCGILSSTPVAITVQSYMNPTSISAHVLGKLKIDDFDNTNINHIRIAELCKQGHQTSDQLLKEKLINDIDEVVKKIYSIG